VGAAGFTPLSDLGIDPFAERNPGSSPQSADRTQRPRPAKPAVSGSAFLTLPYIPLVRTQTIEGMPALLDRMNVRFEDLLRRTGLPEIPLDRQADLLPLREVLAVLECAARATGIECFGVPLATAEGLDALGDYGRYIKAAPTLLEAIRRADRYISWQTLGARLTLRNEGTACVWRYELTRAVRANRHHAYFFALVLMRDVVRLAAGPHWFPREIRLERSAPVGHSRRLKEAFGEHITWGAGENALALGQDLLALPLAWARSSPARSVAADAAAALESTTPSTDFIDSLRRLIRSFLPAGYPRAALLAHASGLSLRSFQRALTLAGLSFSDVVEQVRFEMATEMMRDARARLLDIALELGYADAANFTRAFRRWTGQSPLSYRQTHPV
jgi:AraC-like DNA-binding protein